MPSKRPRSLAYYVTVTRVYSIKMGKLGESTALQLVLP
jgi:hypothetical protein